MNEACDLRLSARGRGLSRGSLPGRAGALLVALLVAGGCGADASHGAGNGSAEPALPLGTLSGTTPGGIHVQVTFSPDPPVVGMVELTLDFHDAPPDPEQVSVDLVSPEMPAHGVTRHEASPGDEPGRFHVRVPVPMGGLWEFYVNLDVGHEAVSFAVRVPEGEEGDPAAHPEHHGAHGPDGDHQHHVP